MNIYVYTKKLDTESKYTLHKTVTASIKTFNAVARKCREEIIDKFRGMKVPQITVSTVKLAKAPLKKLPVFKR